MALQSVTQGSTFSHSPENDAEVTLIAKACFLANLGDGFIGISEKILRLGDSKSIQICEEGSAGDLLEKNRKATGAGGAHPSHVGNSNRFIVVLLYVAKGRRQTYGCISLTVERL